MSPEMLERRLASLSARLSRDVQYDVKTAPDGRLVGNWNEFQEFLNVGEYELAWDALSELASRQAVESDFWSEMALIAQAMGLNERAATAAGRAKGDGPNR